MCTNWNTLTIFRIVSKSKYTKYKLVLDTYYSHNEIIPLTTLSPLPPYRISQNYSSHCCFVIMVSITVTVR